MIAQPTETKTLFENFVSLLRSVFVGEREDVIEAFAEIEGVRLVRNINIQWTGEGVTSAIWLPDRACPTVVYRSPDCEGTYFQYGLHRLGDDYLTYIAKADEEPIIIHMVDCRESSPTLHNKLSVALSPDVSQAIVVPRGVAHLPTKLKGALCVNNHRWYYDSPNYLHYNRKFDIQNVPANTESKDFPVVRVARTAVPIWAYPLYAALVRLRIVPENDFEVPFYFDGTLEGKQTTIRLRRKHKGSLPVQPDDQTQLRRENALAAVVKVLRRHDELNTCIELLKTELEMFPNSVACNFALAETLDSNSREEEAVPLYYRVLELSPPDALAIKCRLYLASSLATLNRESEALTHLVGLIPTNAEDKELL